MSGMAKKSKKYNKGAPISQVFFNWDNAIEKGLAGNEYKFSKPFKEIIKLSVNQHGAKLNEADKQAVEKLIKDVNQRYSRKQVSFRFMGIKGDLKRKIEKIQNVTCFFQFLFAWFFHQLLLLSSFFLIQSFFYDFQEAFLP